MHDEAVRAHQPAVADNAAAANAEASTQDEEVERRLFGELERTAAYLYGDGAAAVDEAIRRLRANPAR